MDAIRDERGRLLVSLTDRQVFLASWAAEHLADDAGSHLAGELRRLQKLFESVPYDSRKISPPREMKGVWQ